MSECRVCLGNNVRMHPIHNTWYQVMYEKLSGTNLEKENGKPETVCYVCNSQLQKFYNFYKMAQNAENILTKRLLLGTELPTANLSYLHLKMTSTQSFSFIDSGEDFEPEVTVTVKEEPVDDDSDFKDDDLDNFLRLDSPFAEEVVESAPDIGIHIPEVQIETEKQWPSDKEFKNDIFIKTEPLDKTEENQNIAESLLRNLSLALDNFQPDIKFCPKNYFYCETCNYKTHTENAMSRHSKVHDQNNQFSCQFCEYRFVNEKKLANHWKYCTVCSICGKKFSNTHGLKIHIRLHTGIQPFECDSCGRGFNQKTNLQTHLRVHTRDKQYPCQLCNKTFPFKSFLQRHMFMHSENVDAASYRQIIDCHKVSIPKRRVLTDCKICGKVLVRKSLPMHMKLHTGERIPCERCNRVFTQKCNLLTHVERVHIGDETLCCPVCHKMFPFTNEMRNHYAMHETFELPRCLDFEINAEDFEMFHQKQLYGIHSAINNGESVPYPCDMCGTTRVLSY